MEFPATLYKVGTAFEWDGATFDFLVVNDSEEADAAAKDGWSIGKPVPKSASAKKEPS
jgi:hypothetical protein